MTLLTVRLQHRVPIALGEGVGAARGQELIFWHLDERLEVLEVPGSNGRREPLGSLRREVAMGDTQLRRIISSQVARLLSVHDPAGEKLPKGSLRTEVIWPLAELRHSAPQRLQNGVLVGGGAGAREGPSADQTVS